MPENAYWVQIERYFVKKRGSALILSPTDWPLVTSWQERDIPLEVIFEGINKAFARLEEKQKSSQRRTILTLTFCQRDIEDAWNAWKERHPEFLGKDARETTLSDEYQKLTAKLRSTARQLQKHAANPSYHCIHNELIAASETLESLIPLVEQAEEQATLVAIKAHIRRVAQQLADHLEQAVDPETRQKLYAKAESRLSSHKHKMNESVYQETLRLAFIQELRKAYPLPFLSSFQ